MRVLLLEGDAGAATNAAAELRAAGHTLTRCHESGVDVFPCNGLAAGHECPLDSGSIDVAVVVRGDAPATEGTAPVPTATEDGVSCALRRFIPLVVVGPEQSPFLDHATAISADAGTVVPAVEHAAAAPLPRHSEAARQALREVLDTHGLPDVTADARVRRVGNDLRVVLRTSDEVPPIVHEMASVRAVGAMRAFDPHTEVIDVTLKVGSA
jgi:hypothetical protein